MVGGSNPSGCVPYSLAAAASASARRFGAAFALFARTRARTAAGAVSGALADLGISDKFIKELSESLPSNSSALFILANKMTEDRVLPELESFGGKILKTSLSHEDETKLQAAMAAAKQA